MKIGFEAKRAFKNFTGLGNYARSVITVLATHYPKNQYFIYTPTAPQNSRTSFLFQLQNVIIKTAPIKLLKSYWRRQGVVKDLVKDGVEIYHGLSHELPKGLKKHGIKSVVTIHDLIYLRYPQYFKWLDRQIYDLKFRLACKNANQIIAISEQTKRDIIQFFGTAESKIKVVYQGCDAKFYQSASSEKIKEVQSKYQLPKEFLLCVGTIENRKNQLLILEALSNLPKSIPLVLVGKQTAYYQILQDYIQQKQLQNSVIFLKDVPFQDLPAIYQSAKIFVYPSKFEGFGIPILEALNCGVPVIATTGSCLEEAGGKDSLYVDPENASDLNEAILKVWNDENLQEEMISQGKKYALNFRDEKIAANLMQVYQKLDYA
jgi:glycosyltransferase involved in cell wall biosynthesis